MSGDSLFRRAGFCLVAALALGLPAVPLRAVVVTFGAPPSEVAGGGSVHVELFVLNPSGESVSYELPDNFNGRLTKGDHVWQVSLPVGSGHVIIPANGFVRLPLVFALPSDATGQLVMELAGPAPVRTVIEVAPIAGGAAQPKPGAAAAADFGGEMPARLAASRLKRYYSDHFSAHEPMYFVFGGDKPAAKFQLSFKYRILNDGGPLATRFPDLKGLHVGYTQRSLWDITSNSSPFYDSSYMPEFMFESLATDTGKHEGFTWLGYQAAVQHESNGRDGQSSRSMNTFYFRPMFVLGDPEGWRIIFRPKFFVYLGSLDDNPDIKTYRGYSELRAIVGKSNRLSVSVTGRVGEKFDKGCVQFDVSYPTEFLTGNFAMYLLAQYWTGYGESLLHYDQRSSTARIGFSLAR
jgi:outer membrane phospholipase A